MWITVVTLSSIWTFARKQSIHVRNGGVKAESARVFFTRYKELRFVVAMMPVMKMLLEERLSNLYKLLKIIKKLYVI